MRMHCHCFEGCLNVYCKISNLNMTAIVGYYVHCTLLDKNHLKT